MRKLREVLRLRFELKLGYQQIGRSCAIAVSTVHKYLKRAEAAGVSWPPFFLHSASLSFDGQPLGTGAAQERQQASSGDVAHAAEARGR